VLKKRDRGDPDPFVISLDLQHRAVAQLIRRASQDTIANDHAESSLGVGFRSVRFFAVDLVNHRS